MTERLDRIESILEALSINIVELKNRTDSNAKSIEALTHQMSQDREDAKQEREEMRKYREVQRKDRAHVFEWMARLAAAQADYYEAQADYLRHVEQIDDRLTEILTRTTPPKPMS
ncbi:MAG: hypothetical protein ACRC6M_11550 [Microcystaceae cyanobacterium]